MERIILRHVSGSKAPQVEEFPLSQYKELTIGRDPSVAVKYDPTREDLVGRQHAKIAQNPMNPMEFTITDLNSRNGTFVNRQRINGTVRISPGDTVQFGPGGPELQFDVYPRPVVSTAGYGGQSTGAPPPTRMGGPPSPPPTVVAGQPGMNQPPMGQPYGGPPPTGQPYGGPPPTGPGGYGAAPGQVGKATVERMIQQNKSSSLKYVLIGGGALLLLLMVVAGGIIYWMMTSAKKLEGDIGALGAKSSNAPMSAADIANLATKSVVYVEVGWKLIYTPTGGQVYHEYVRAGNGAVPVYVVVDGKVEPRLTLDASAGYPIGGEHSGSGFAVTSDGYILTNRHVAATWRTAYSFPQHAAQGVVKVEGGYLTNPDGSIRVIPAPADWVPSESKQGSQQLQGGFEGRNDYMNVTFAKNDLRIPAKTARVSDRHDAALIKIDLPESVSKLEINDNYDTIKPGDATYVLGYPGVSPAVYGVVRSQDVFNRENKVKIVPDPTMSVGNIGRVIRGEEGKDKQTYSSFGDAYQLTINSTGSGNSGGPVFDDKGRVIGIFFAGRQTDALVTFAVPIRYGKELMGVGAPK